MRKSRLFEEPNLLRDRLSRRFFLRWFDRIDRGGRVRGKSRSICDTRVRLFRDPLNFANANADADAGVGVDASADTSCPSVLRRYFV